MPISLDGPTGAPSVVAPLPTTPTAASASTVNSPPSGAQADTVQLSEDAQIHLLVQQGVLATQIAANLGISVATVDGYLGITVPATPAVVASTTPANTTAGTASSNSTAVPASTSPSTS